MKTLKRIALFGGTFDPPHRAHICIAKIALKKCKLDRVIFIPCHYPPLAKGFRPSPQNHRLKMLQLLLEGAGEKKFEISEVELKRKQKKSYSYVTAEYFRKKYPRAELFWIIGSDRWDDIDQWKNLPRLKQLVTFLIFPRPHTPKPKLGVPFVALKTKPIDISSTQIRNTFKQGKLPSSLLTPPMLKYIQKQRLYV